MKTVFKAKLSKIGSRQVLLIPIKSSEKLPSRGMVMVNAVINGTSFIAPLEPDGRGSHWFELSDTLSGEVKIKLGESAEISIEPIKDWPEPEVPKDIIDEIDKAGLMQKWNGITTKARWDWLRWIRATANPETRKKRIDVACSKLQRGDTHPCCFDRTRSTITDVSKSGVLLDL